jgi:hypothetical protein
MHLCYNVSKLKKQLRSSRLEEKVPDGAGLALIIKKARFRTRIVNPMNLKRGHTGEDGNPQSNNPIIENRKCR